ncbi:MAG: MAPEG family protein [Pseudomonadota bacterium]|nr:MAPEG family protein [Pseudomonadota bacterium]MDE3140767.1 MAPEG family protein [Pseudomonadota bacterium]
MLLLALIAALTVLLLLVSSILVGRARGLYGIKAPATTGHPDFERAFRAQMNTQEAALMFLPTLALAAWLGQPLLASVFGAIWLLARAWYLAAYLRDADKRGPAFALGALMQVALLVLVFVALVRAALM